jgi:hypothetical protein
MRTAKRKPDLDDEIVRETKRQRDVQMTQESEKQRGDMEHTQARNASDGKKIEKRRDTTGWPSNEMLIARELKILGSCIKQSSMDDLAAPAMVEARMPRGTSTSHITPLLAVRGRRKPTADRENK